MADDAELQARIAALAGQINRAKQQPPPNTTTRQYNYQYQPRWGPYATRPTTFKNRTLINSTTHHSPTDDDIPPPTAAPSTGFVKTRGTNNQLMTQSTYAREQSAKHTYSPTIHSVKRQRVEAPTTKLTHPRIIELEGLQFEMQEDGSKLVRRDLDNTKKTPRTATIAGVSFQRTTKGNLRRVIVANTAASESAKRQCENFMKNGTRCSRTNSTRSGTCPFGPKCRFAHDPNKVAICKVYLRKGACPNGDHCDLSHKPTYHRVPACTHFQKDACTNEDCRYSHVHVTSGPSVCRPFALLGYCDQGLKCNDRHVFECPDYANTGECPNLEKCNLPHVLRAGASRSSDRDSEIDESSDEEPFIVDAPTGAGYQLAGNEDFVALT